MADHDRWLQDRNREGRYDDDRHRIDEVRRAYGTTSGSRFDPSRDRPDYGNYGRGDSDDRAGYGRQRQVESRDDQYRGRDERGERDRDGFWGQGRQDRGFGSDPHRQYSREDYGATDRGPEPDDRGRFGSSGYRRSDNDVYGRDFRTQGRGYSERGRDDERGFIDRATDEVSSWFGDRDAERRREMDHRGRGPKGYQRSDSRVQDDVSDRLADDSYLDASNIEVTVSNGEVTLAGSVDSRNARRRAEDLAEQVSGVSYVQNNLRVGSSQSGRSAVDATRTQPGAGLGENIGSPTTGATSSGAGLSRSAIAGMSSSGAGIERNGTNGDQPKSAT